MVIESFHDVEELLRARDPQSPVYCVYPYVYERSTRRFLDGFGGRVLYAVKANNHPEVLGLLHLAGVRHFDCASLPEIELVTEHCPNSKIYYMNPVRLEGHARDAQRKFAVRHFVVDHHSGLESLLHEIDPGNAVIFARMAVSHSSAMEDLSVKFGARPENIPGLMAAISASGAEPALAFNVGSGVTSPEAYTYAMKVAQDVLMKLPYRVRLVDIGGGFPISYPGFSVPDLERYFESIANAASDMPLTDNGELMAEPGRALSAPGLSAVTKVLLRKADRIYLNDGMYGAFWELRFKGHTRYPCRTFRNGKALHGDSKLFRIFGPTCDSSDQLPESIELPADIDIGDHIEFGNIGAYSLSGRTTFNGFYSEDVVRFSSTDASPPTGAASVCKNASN